MTSKTLMIAWALLFAACGGEAEKPEPELPIAKHCYVAPDNASYNCDGRPDPDGFAFQLDCRLLGPSGVPEVPYHFGCVLRGTEGPS